MDYSEQEVETALGLVAEAGDPPTEVKTGADVQHRAAWVLAQEAKRLLALIERPENERVKQLKIAQASIDSLEREVRGQWAELEQHKKWAGDRNYCDSCGKSILNIVTANATVARAQAALEAMQNMRRYAPDRCTGAAVDICVRFLKNALVAEAPHDAELHADRAHGPLEAAGEGPSLRTSPGTPASRQPSSFEQPSVCAGSETETAITAGSVDVSKPSGEQ